MAPSDNKKMMLAKGIKDVEYFMCCDPHETNDIPEQRDSYLETQLVRHPARTEGKQQDAYSTQKVRNVATRLEVV